MRRIAVLILLVGCVASHRATDDAAPPDGADEPPDGGTADAWVLPPTDELDLLLMIDNSNGTSDQQALLGLELPRLVRALASGDRDDDGSADFIAVRSLHVGVVTSDLGAGPSPPPGIDGVVPSCDPGLGDDGILRTDGVTARPGCVGSYPPVFEFVAGGDEEAFVRDVACVASMGTGGCGFEQQLEAVLKAVSPVSSTASYVPDGYVVPTFVGIPHGDELNAGFVRPLSVLAVVLLTNEEDCSVPDYSIFYRDPRFSSVALNLRCFTFADWLYPVTRYVGLASLRVDPRRLVYGAIVGVPSELAGSDAAAFDAMLADPRMIETPDPSMSPPARLLASCTGGGAGEALPPRRMVEVARGLDARGSHATVQSICADDFGPAVDEILDQIALALAGI